mgnify:FL=1
MLNNDALDPGYGQLNDITRDAINLAATREGFLLDSVYSGKAMAVFLKRARQGGPN